MKYSTGISNFLEISSLSHSKLSLCFFFFSFFSFIFISWRLITLLYCSGFCHTLTWISHGFTCVPHPIPLPTSFPIRSLLRKAFLSLLAILWNYEFKWVYFSFSPLLFTAILFTAICKSSLNNHFALLHFFFLGMILITTSHTVSQTSIHSYSSTLSDLIPWICLPFLLYNHKGFDLGHAWMV